MGSSRQEKKKTVKIGKDNRQAKYKKEEIEKDKYK